MTVPTRISVVIPVRSDAGPLAQCLAALDSQTVAPFEVIVVDNASTDASAAVAARFGARVVPEPRVGIAFAAAAGYDAARGQVIARLDADSLPPADWVGRISQRLADEQWDGVTGTGTFRELGRAAHIVSAVYLGLYYALCHAAAARRPLWGSNMAMRRRVWLAARERVHGDPEVHDDLDLSFALDTRVRIAFDRSLRVGVSARSLVGARQLVRRFGRAFHTLAVNWRIHPPWRRWALRFANPNDHDRGGRR